MENTDSIKVVQAGKYKILAKNPNDLTLASFMNHGNSIKKGTFQLHGDLKNGNREYFGYYEGLKAIQDRILNNPKNKYLVNCIVDFGNPEDFGYGLIKLIEHIVPLEANFLFCNKEKKSLCEGYNLKNGWSIFVINRMIEEFLLSDNPTDFFEELMAKTEKVYPNFKT